ncbi:MAG: aromatic ring-hydroxylating dioxygenase subunit alpha [bacterium]|nr:aromatic ring-hydroxylating dioxygenase subunit alpha [bacterium]MDE0239210.1 aromatic ring-hydroxylating dioxygenase subunit alpha [bacterium]
MSTTYVRLDEVSDTLPSIFYYDRDHHDRELRQIWYRQWLLVGRSDVLAAVGDYRVVEVGDQSIIITRDGNHRLQAFHNTCRHRGSVLCQKSRGTFRAGRIVCPYHAWAYSLEGELTATPWRLEGGGFDAARYPLYKVAVGEWAGFIFVNLDENAAPFDDRTLGDTPALLANWNLGETVTVHTMTLDLECNWKAFWDNFNECLHCPGVHPELCRIVPQFREGLATGNVVRGDGDTSSPLIEGAVTWSVGGATSLPWFEGLTEREQRAGATFGVFPPSGYVVTHVDYARLVHMLPTGPECTRLEVSWLVPPKTVEHPGFSVEKLIELAETVVREDGRASEINQKGLRSNRHMTGVLVPQEIFVREFHDWVREQLADADG